MAGTGGTTSKTAGVTLPRLAAAAAAVALTGLVAAAPSVATAAVDTPTTTEGCISSVPEPNSAAPVQICYTLFRPAGASASRPVPVVLHGHGWGGSRTTDAAAFSRYLDDGYGVLSFDQRGFGESGGLAHVLDPDVEGRDVIGLVDVVAAQDWVQKEQGRGKPDPVLGAIGGSYGGGYQFLGAFTELRDTGATRFDALVPEITWNDLKTALAPDEVSRSTWQSLLAAIAAQDADETVLRGFAYGAATGLWPGEGDLPGTDLDAFYEEKGPRWHVEQGRRLDVPVLLGQGLNDNLFNVNQGLANFDTALTPSARARSIFVGYNGGHVLPNALPPAESVNGDPCSARLNSGSGDFAALAKRFFDENLKGLRTGLSGHGLYHLTTADATTCLTLSSVAPTRSVRLGEVATTTAAGGPVHHELASGPLTVAGVGRVDATVSAVGVENKAFFALSTGTSPADAKVVQNNMMPLREEQPLLGSARSIELPGIAVRVPEGEKLYLTVSPVSDMSAAAGSRTPGAFVLRDTVVQVPVMEDAVEDATVR